MTLEKARDLLRSDVAYFGTMMMMQGMADGMVSGAAHSTANTMRPALQLIKMAPGFKIASSVFFMLLRDKVYVYGDCAINVSPTASELAEIAATSAGTARAFGISPRVAMLSYATGDSNTGPMIDKVSKHGSMHEAQQASSSPLSLTPTFLPPIIAQVREATEMARELAPSELIEGPIQFDAVKAAGSITHAAPHSTHHSLSPSFLLQAVDPAVAKVKYKEGDNPVAGKATVCIFPDLNAGNNAYKAVQQASKASAVGPIMQGLRMPVNDLSRGCTVEDVVNTVVCTSLQSIAAKAEREARAWEAKAAATIFES